MSSTTKKEEKLKNDVLVDQMKHLAEQFNAVNIDKGEDLEESCENIVLNEEVMRMAKPNCDDERVQKHADEFNKNIERNKKLLNQFTCVWRCADVNELADKSDFGLSIMCNLK